MKFIAFYFLLLWSSYTAGQSVSEEYKYVSGLKHSDIAPDGLLSFRAAVLFSDDYSPKDLQEIQKAFQQIGIDVVSYIESERVLAGADLKNAYTLSFIKRDIKFLIFAHKENSEFQFFILPLGIKNYWTRPGQTAWLVRSTTLPQLLTSIYRAIVSTQKRQNFLINDFPEQGIVINFLAEDRNETMIPNVKAFKIAIPRLSDPEANVSLQGFLKENFPVKYELVDDTLREKDLVEKGFRYILRYIHTRGSLAKEMMGYDMSKSESALATATYPNGSLQLKTIPSQTIVYKFYLKDLEDKGVYFGTKWDADVTWLDALKNHFDAYRASGRIN